MAKFGIGIDTGGTYTDAVVYDFEARSVLAGTKALTSHDDLARGILEALDALPREFLHRPALISLSTTLATNACVENRIGRAKLFFFGGDKKTIDAYGRDYGLPAAADIFLIPCRSSYSEGIVHEVDWAAFDAIVDGGIANLDGAGIIELYSMRNGAVVEKEAKERLRKKLALPVICGHELVSNLSCLQRGASTLLNAGLFPTIDRFQSAIKAALAARNIDAPVVMVRSDGNLMSEAFASFRPAETLLSGPAASVMGGLALAHSQTRDCLVVDMGGTTTDIAIVRDNRPVKATDGIAIGAWKTGITGLFIHTVGLGADSAVHYNQDGLVLESYRVTPVSQALAEYPALVENFRQQIAAQGKHTRFIHEGFILARDIAGSPRHTDLEKRFCANLEAGPRLLTDAARAVGKDEYNLDVTRLVREGVVRVFGLTPTDIMHLKGDFARHDSGAARMAAEFVANCLGVDVGELSDMVYAEVRKKMYLNIVQALLRQENPRYEQEGHNEFLAETAFDFYRRAVGNQGKGFIQARFTTDLPLVGVGAPIHIFLPEVAAMLGTRAIIGPHAAVANALGAVVGKVQAECTIHIRANYNTEGINGYTVFGNVGNESFKEREEAERFALREAETAARAEALRRGARGDVAVTTRLESQDGQSRAGNLHLGSNAVAHAVGGIGM